MREKRYGRRKPDRKTTILLLICYVGNMLVILGFFYPRNPSGAYIYVAWFTLGYLLVWLGLPRVADAADWARLFRKKLQKRDEETTDDTTGRDETSDSKEN